jgi:hypothetical protein
MPAQEESSQSGGATPPPDGTLFPSSFGEDGGEPVENTSVPVVALASFWVWIGSAVAGFAGTAYALTDYGDLTNRLEGIAREQQLTATPEQLETAAQALLLGTLGAVLVLGVAQLALAGVLWTRRNWARGVLAGTAVLTLVVFVVAQELMTGSARLCLLLQALLVIVASILMLLPPSNAWFRRRA